MGKMHLLLQRKNERKRKEKMGGLARAIVWIGDDVVDDADRQQVSR